MEQSFFAQHSQIVATVMGVMATLLGFMVMTFGAFVWRSNRREQDQQNRELDYLRREMEAIKRGNVGTDKDVERIDETLVRMLQELVDYRKENKQEHDHIIGMLRNGQTVSA